MINWSSLVRTLALSLTVTPVLSQAQTMAPAEASSTNAAPAAAVAPVPAPTPAPVVTPAPADTTTATTERPTTYTMQPGDSLDSIAKKFETSIRALAKLNKISKPEYRKLRAGKVLQIPPARTEAPAAK